jgi:hypothetical protein
VIVNDTSRWGAGGTFFFTGAAGFGAGSCCPVRCGVWTADAGILGSGFDAEVFRSLASAAIFIQMPKLTKMIPKIAKRNRAVPATVPTVIHLERMPPPINPMSRKADPTRRRIVSGVMDELIRSQA